MQELQLVRSTVDRMTASITVATGSVKAFTSTVAGLHHKRRATRPGTIPNAFFREALALHAALLPVLKELQRACEQLVEAIEGTWTPPTN